MDDHRFNTTTTLPNPQEIARTYGDYLGKTTTVPRPTETDPLFRHVRDDQERREHVAAAQAQWDRAEAKRKEIDGWVATNRADREAAEQATRDAQAAAHHEARKAERAALEEQLKRAYLETPGALPEDWTPDLAQRLITEHLVQQAGRADATARGVFAQQNRRDF